MDTDQEKNTDIRTRTICLFVAFACAALTLIGVGVIASESLFLSEDERAKQAIIDAWSEEERAYNKDAVGGATPEETLALFIAALEVGDIQKASEYVVVYEREGARDKLISFQEKKLMSDLVSYLKNHTEKYPLNSQSQSDDYFIFESFNNMGDLVLQVSITKTPNGTWQILDF